MARRPGPIGDAEHRVRERLGGGVASVRVLDDGRLQAQCRVKRRGCGWTGTAFVTTGEGRLADALDKSTEEISEHVCGG